MSEETENGTTQVQTFLPSTIHDKVTNLKDDILDITWFEFFEAVAEEEKIREAFKEVFENREDEESEEE